MDVSIDVSNKVHFDFDLSALAVGKSNRFSGDKNVFLIRGIEKEAKTKVASFVTPS